MSRLKRIEKKFLSCYPCYDCKYNCSMSYDPIFNKFGFLTSAQNIRVACFARSQIHEKDLVNFRILKSEPCPLSCDLFSPKKSLEEEISDFLKDTTF